MTEDAVLPPGDAACLNGRFVDAESAADTACWAAETARLAADTACWAAETAGGAAEAANVATGSDARHGAASGAARSDARHGAASGAAKLETLGGIEYYDANGGYLVPGFIDLHIHGAAGFLADNGADDLEAMCRLLPRYGVTGFLPAVAPAADDVVHLCGLSSARHGIGNPPGLPVGAQILGFFLEGHYLKLHGAIRDIARDYSAEKLEALYSAASPHKLVFGVSPEIGEVLALLPAMARDGYPAFITHTCASAGETAEAIALGARHATHFYDVFPYPGDREPGVRGCGAVEAVLADPSATVDFILDGEHVEAAAVKMALACKGPGGVCLVTDANVNAGLPPGTYKGIGGDEIVVAYDGGPARMGPRSRSPGSLIGSGLTMDMAVRNAVLMLGVTLPQAVRMASLNPAAVLGLHNRKGRVAVGYDADFSIMDGDMNIQACFVGGRLH